jgi:quercetin dioxygenase-like cupin family protein
MKKRKAMVIAAIGLAGVAIFGVTALATAGGGLVGTTPVRGTIAGDVHLNADRIKFQTKGDTDVVVQTITYAKGGFSGWHTHPGFVLGLVESGAITIQVGCSTNTYSAGQAFVESGTDPIMARNLGATPAVVRASFIVPQGVATRRDVPASQIPECD